MSPEHPNATLIQRFYEAFDRGDADSMAAAYAPGVVFSYPAFGELRGDDAREMWRRRCSNATDLSVEARDISADDSTGRAHWTARYTFGTGRKVVNEIDARFRFEDGRIVEHHDSFSLWRWSRQALGPAAFVVATNPMGRKALRRSVRGRLTAWKEGRGE